MRLTTQNFRKTEKLHTSGEFERVFKQGRKYLSPYFVTYILVVGEGRARAGFSVSRKIGGAVERNRVKRRLREAYRRIKVGLQSGAEIVIIARSAAKAADFKTITKAMEETFVKARIMEG